MKKCLSFISVLLVVLCCVTSQDAFALPSVQGTNITTTPISVNLTGKPGHSVTTTLQVENNESVPIRIGVQLETFRPYGTSGQAQIYPGKASDAFLKWVKFSKTSLVAQPNIWSPITMTITLPATASMGYYYAVVFKPQTAALPIKHNTESVKSGNAVLVLLNAQNGNEHPQLKVSKFSINKKLFEFLPAQFSVLIKNTGNIYLPPSGDIYISRNPSGGNVIDTLPINPAAGNVLPGSSRLFRQSFADGFPVYVPKLVNGQKITDKHGNVVQRLQWNFSNAKKFRFGKYYAKLVMVYNNGSMDIPTTAVVSFWVIPWKILSISLLFVILAAVGLFGMGRKLVARAYHLSKKVRK